MSRIPNRLALAVGLTFAGCIGLAHAQTTPPDTGVNNISAGNPSPYSTTNVSAPSTSGDAAETARTGDRNRDVNTTGGITSGISATDAATREAIQNNMQNNAVNNTSAGFQQAVSPTPDGRSMNPGQVPAPAKPTAGAPNFSAGNAPMPVQPAGQMPGNIGAGGNSPLKKN